MYHNFTLPVLLADFYKIDHVRQYPGGITRVYSNWTPRKSRVPGVEKVVVFGHQYFITEYLIGTFNREFFSQPWENIREEYVRVIRSTLGIQDPPTDHLKKLHETGFLPIKIYAVPEGYSVNIGIPSLVIFNTQDHAFWLPNFLETLLSMCLWKPSTSATTALQFRKIGMAAARENGETDFGFVDYQFHDFSMRGMSGLEDAVLSGMGHLLSFNGTDTIPAILGAERYYYADITKTGTSVPATEHSVMCAGGLDGEFETFRRLIEDIYPSGIVSIVSDTWDLWQVLTDFIPRLKDSILSRNGKIVIRPDSGDPVKIVIGRQMYYHLFERTGDELNPYLEDTPENLGVIQLLARVLGVTNGLINNAGCIYGDSITPERAQMILKGISAMDLSTYNMVFGVGSFSMQYVTRDTYGFAMKATAIEKNGTVIPIFKDPKTDSGMKRSRKGILAVYKFALRLKQLMI
jgi:nicotinamide phosphoribosyltransferase